MYKISDVNIYIDYFFICVKSQVKDSIIYNNFNLYSYDKLKYKLCVIIDVIFIIKGNMYVDFRIIFLLCYLNNLKIFNYFLI